MPETNVPSRIVSTALDDTILSNIDCVANGSITKTAIIGCNILSVCQRASDPCVVEINFEISGDDSTYDIYQTYTLFSLDTTDGIDGTWHELEASSLDPAYTGDVYEVRGKVNGTFVADMCNHVSTFMSDTSVTFRITLVKISGFLGPADSVTPGLR